MGLKKKRYMSWILILLSHFNDTHHDQSLFFFFGQVMYWIVGDSN